MPMKSIRKYNSELKKYGTLIVLVVFVVSTYYCLKRQYDKNHSRYKKKMEVVRAAEARKNFLLIIYPDAGSSYVDAYDRIMKSDAQVFWIKTHHFCPTVILNYYVYPKELKMSEATQKLLMEGFLGRSSETLVHTPPGNYEEIIEIDFDPTLDNASIDATRRDG